MNSRLLLFCGDVRSLLSCRGQSASWQAPRDAMRPAIHLA